MSEITWVFGPSAAGKATFINQVIRPEAVGLRQQLGWKNNNIMPCQESLRWVGVKRDKKDPLVLRRSKLTSTIIAMSDCAEVILVKGKDVDLVNGGPNNLYRQLPAHRHRVIYINFSTAELM